MQWISVAVLWKRIKSLRFLIKDKNVSIGKKILVVVGVAYLFLPIDIIPEPIFFVGIIDDIILWGFILNYLKNELDRYWQGEPESPPDKDAIDPKKDLKGKVIFEGSAEEVPESESQEEKGE